MVFIKSVPFHLQFTPIIAVSPDATTVSVYKYPESITKAMVGTPLSISSFLQPEINKEIMTIETEILNAEQDLWEY